MLNSKLLRDLSLRFSVLSSEDFRLSLKTIQYSSFFPDPFLRFFCSSRLSRFSSFPSQLRNRCVLSSRSRGVSRSFKISRLMVQDLASKGLLPGLKKAC